MAEVNKLQCNVDIANTGKVDGSCDIKMKEPALLYLTKKRYNITPADITPAFIAGEIAKRNIYQVPDIDGHTIDFEATVIETSPTGVDSKSRDGKPKFNFIIRSGNAILKEIKKLNGQNRWNLIIQDTAGHWWGVENNDGTFRGYRLSMSDSGNRIPSDGSTSEQILFTCQIVSPEDWNCSSVITADQHGIDSEEIQGVQAVFMDVPVAPAAAQDEVEVLVVANSDRGTSISGFDGLDFRVKKTDSSNVVTFPTLAAGDAVQKAGEPEIYVITLPSNTASGDKYEFDLYNNADNRPVVTKELENFASVSFGDETKASTVVA